MNKFTLRLIAATSILSAFPLVAQAGCLDDVNALAKRYNVQDSLPSAAKTTGQTLTQSGGVIKPPATGDLSGAMPAAPNPDSMQTAPVVQEQGALSGGKAAKIPEHHAAADSQAASLLQAARDAAGSGDESVCRQRLTDAMKLLSASGTSP